MERGRDRIRKVKGFFEHGDETSSVSVLSLASIILTSCEHVNFLRTTLVPGNDFYARITRRFSLDIYFQYIPFNHSKSNFKNRYLQYDLERGSKLGNVTDSCNATHLTQRKTT